MRYGDAKCNHDSTHRVCAKLVDENTMDPLTWGSAGDFWMITGQKQWQWDQDIINEPNAGDSWCICMWAFANLISKVGCDNIHIRCPSTDVSYVLDRYDDYGHDLTAAHECLKKTCPAS